MKKGWLRILAGAAAATTLLAGCAGGGTNGASSEGAQSQAVGGDRVKIAVAAPMTGDNSEYGLGFYNAAQLMAQEWNEKGGVLGKQIQIVQFDDKNTPEEAATIAQKIASEGDYAAVIGHFASGVSMTAAPTYQENKIIEISPSASHPDYSGIGDYIFRNNTVISTEGKAAVDIAVHDFGKKKVGIISIMTDWGTSTSKIIEDLIQESGEGAQVVAHEEVMEGSDDYTPAITKLNEAGADVVILCGMYNLVAPVAKQYKQINPDIQIVGFSNAYSQQLLELGGDAVNGVAFPVSFFAESEDPAVKAYVEKFQSQYGGTPSALTSQAYDSVGVLLTAIQEAGSLDHEAIKEKLYAVTYPGVTGELKFDANGDADKAFTKVIVKGGRFTKMD